MITFSWGFQCLGRKILPVLMGKNSFWNKLYVVGNINNITIEIMLKIFYQNQFSCFMFHRILSPHCISYLLEFTQVFLHFYFQYFFWYNSALKSAHRVDHKIPVPYILLLGPVKYLTLWLKTVAINFCSLTNGYSRYFVITQ